MAAALLLTWLELQRDAAEACLLRAPYPFSVGPISHLKQSPQSVTCVPATCRFWVTKLLVVRTLPQAFTLLPFSQYQGLLHI
jgi:hypothetical protein